MPPGVRPHQGSWFDKATTDTALPTNTRGHGTAGKRIPLPLKPLPVVAPTYNVPGAVGGMAQYSASNPSSLATLNHGVVNRGGAIPMPVDPLAGYVPQTADLSQDPYAPAYAKLLQFVKDSAAARGGQFDSTKSIMQNQQATANQGLYDAYQNSRNSADASATALGVDPNVISQVRDLAMRKNQENSDQSLADNLAWLDKGKLLEGSMLNSDAIQFAQEGAGKTALWDANEQKRINDLNTASLQALVQSAQSARSSSGKGSSGSKSKSASGDIAETAKETQTLANGGMDKAAYDEILANYGPEAAAQFLNEFNTTSGSPLQKAAQTKVNELAATNQINGKPVKAASIYFPNPNAKWQAPKYTAAQKAATQLAIQQAILTAAGGFSGNMGNPKTTQTVTKSAKGKS